MTKMPERPSRRNGKGVSAAQRRATRQRPALSAYGRDRAERISHAERWLEARFLLPSHLACLTAVHAGFPTGDDE